MTAGRFRKKPVEVEAMQFDGTVESANRVLAWIGGHGAKALRARWTDPEAGIVIKTLEGDMLATPGDYVIRGVQGEQVRMAGNAVTPPAARDLVGVVAESLGVVL